VSVFIPFPLLDQAQNKWKLDDSCIGLGIGFAASLPPAIANRHVATFKSDCTPPLFLFKKKRSKEQSLTPAEEKFFSVTYSFINSRTDP
jgi:hypothetical protein